MLHAVWVLIVVWYYGVYIVIIRDLPNAEYHKRPEMSNSQLKLLAISPMHFTRGESNIAYETRRVGTLIHSAILEEGKGNIHIDFDRPRSSNADREAWAEYFSDVHLVEIDTSLSAKTWYEQFENKTGSLIVTRDEQTMISQIMESLSQNQLACELLDDTEPELSIINSLHGVDCRSRPDASNKARIVDVKSCPDASAHAFASNCAKFGYHRQEAFYSQMHEIEYGIYPEFYFLAVGKSPPYPVVVYQLNHIAKENGAYLIERDFQTYKDCLQANRWPSLDNDLALDIPIYDQQPETVDMALLA